MKKKLVILSAAAMVAAAAVPALAFENEFHGMYRLRANVTNFQAAGLAGIQNTSARRNSRSKRAQLYWQKTIELSLSSSREPGCSTLPRPATISNW